MTRRTAEGRTCELCGRRMLAGERPILMDHAQRREYRRSICELCRRRALTQGWAPSPQAAVGDDGLTPEDA